MTSPTARTKKLFQSAGWIVEITEHWNAFCRRRFDLLEFIDLLAISEHHEIILGIQTTSASNHSARRKKILANKKALAFLKAGGSISIVSWKKSKKTGRRALWVPRIELIAEADFDPT